jgi:uncharacterized coiled-coil protein SlyX
MIIVSAAAIRDKALGAGRSHVNRLIVSAASALVIVGAGLVWRGIAASPAVSSPQSQIAQSPKDPVLNGLIETTTALEASQQQAIDQLQSLQDVVATQRDDAKRSSETIAALNRKVEGLAQKLLARESAPPPSDVQQARSMESNNSVSRPRHHARARHATARHKKLRVAVRGR